MLRLKKVLNFLENILSFLSRFRFFFQTTEIPKNGRGFIGKILLRMSSKYFGVFVKIRIFFSEVKNLKKGQGSDR